MWAATAMHSSCSGTQEDTWQSSALQAGAVSIRKSLSNPGQPKAGLQAGEEEEDLQHRWNLDIGRVCGAQQKPLCDEHWQALALLLIVQLSQQHGDLHGENAGNMEKGETPQVTFFTQVRVKFRDRVWILYNEGRESLRRYLCNF